MRDIREGTTSLPTQAHPGSLFGAVPGLLATGMPTHSHNDVRTLQAFLRNKGYAIDVDGVRGPQTEAAIAAYHKGITARAWNSRSAHAGARTGPPRTTGGRGAPMRGGRTPRRSLHPGTNPLRAAQTAAATNPALAATMSDEERARAMVESEYGPQLDEIRRQQAAVQAAAAQQVANLGRWYGDVGSTAQAVGTQTQQSDAALAAQQQQENMGMLNLFGGAGANGAAGEAAAFADINNQALTQTSAADQAYTANLVPIIKTQGVEAQSAAQSAANAQISELAAQLSGLTAEKGSAYTKYLSDIQQQNLENERSQQALDLAQQLMPSQIATARADARLATTRANLAPIQAARDAKQFGMSVQRYQAELAQTRARTRSILADLKKNADGGIDMNDPNTRSSLGDRLRGSIQTKNGTWRMHPGAAQKNLNLALNQLGLQNNPQARAIANNLLAETANNSVSRGMWTQFRWVNGKIVKGRRTALGRRNRAAQIKAAKG